jgi:hypothetical protein
MKDMSIIAVVILFAYGVYSFIEIFQLLGWK